MNFLRHLMVAALVCVTLAVLGLRTQSNLLISWFPMASWASLVYLAFMAMWLRRAGRLQASMTSAANVVQAFGICAMILGVAAGLYSAVAGASIKSVAELPVARVLAPFVEGLVSMGLGILLSVTIQFGDDDGGSATNLTAELVTDRIGVAPRASIEDFERLRRTLQEANGAAEVLKKNLSEAGGKAGDAARQFSDVIMNVARLVEDLNRFFPAEGPRRDH
jgi:hypothetical protein